MLLMMLAAAAQSALPQPAPPQPPRAPVQPPATMIAEPVALALAGFDSDGHGGTTRAEMEAGVKRSFEQIDTARAGTLRYLDFAEWSLRWLGDRNALPSPFDVDSNGDDAVSLPELQSWFTATFNRLDRNHDNLVSRAEMLTIRAAAADERNGQRGKRPRR